MALPSRSTLPMAVPLWSPGDDPVGLYIHIPFCRALCSYCAFAKGEYDVAQADLWLDGLEREIVWRATSTWSGRPRLATLFLGGGTPSTLRPGQWRRLGELLRAGFELTPDTEFTAEANPESFVPEIASVMREIGVNRLSLGAQSLESSELALLDRLHDAGAVARAVGVARAAGFDNVSLDLMYGLPGQGETTWAATLNGVLGLEPEHLSAYCLSLEPGTRLAARVLDGTLPRPNDDLAAGLYEMLAETAASRGYVLYEISNFARSGRVGRHNLRYWRRDDVLGLGPSSHALAANHRWVNPAPLEAWVRAYENGGSPPAPQPVPAAEARFEWIFLHLRLAEGFSLADFEARWGTTFFAVHGEKAKPLLEGGLLVASEGRVRLTPRARFVSDAVFAEFAP